MRQATYDDIGASASPATLVRRTVAILGGMVALTTLGAWSTWGLDDGLAVLGLAVLFLVTGLGTTLWAHLASDDDPAPIAGGAVFAGVSGAFLGPALSAYTEILGPEQVFAACGITLGITGVVGGVSSLVTFDYRRAESWLMVPLWGLLGFLVFGIFFRVPEAFDNLMSWVGALLFCAFLVVDFVRLYAEGRGGQYGWAVAMRMATSIYLDMVNLLLWILRIMAQSKK
jgi:FtsH-binding integral membrane protein